MSEKLTVAIVSPLGVRGGIATYTSKLIDAMPESRVRVVEVPIESPESKNPLGFLGLVAAIPDSTDIVHVQYEAGLFGRAGVSGIGAPGFFAKLDRRSLPIVTTLHEVHREHLHRGPIGNYLLQLRDWLIERSIVRVSDRVVVHTREAERIVRERHEVESVNRFLHPVEANADIVPKAEAKSELGIDGEIILTFGWVERKKRYKDVIEALPEFPSATFLIAGGKRDGEGEAVLDSAIERARELGVEDQIEYIGYAEEQQVPTLFNAADVVVLPYERVSQSGVVNDALAYQRPVITSDLSAFNELREEYGCLLTYGSRQGLEEALAAVFEDESVRTRLATQAQEYVEAESWSRFGERTARIYADVLNH